MMPAEMTPTVDVDPECKNLDGTVLVKSIQRITSDRGYPGCGTRVCYSITHNSKKDVPKGTVLAFAITGTTNPLSVLTAGPFEVAT